MNMQKIITLLCCYLLMSAAQGQEKSSLGLHIPVADAKDTLVMYIYADRIVEPFHNEAQVLKAPNKNGMFHFDLSHLDRCAWISVYFSFQQSGSLPVFGIWEEFLWEPGDDILAHLTPKLGRQINMEDGFSGNTPIRVENWDIVFSGQGGARMEAQWKVKRLKEAENMNRVLLGEDRKDPTIVVKQLSKVQQQALEIMSPFQSRLNARAYTMLIAQIKGDYGYEIGRTFEKLGYFTKDQDKLGRIAIEFEKYLSQGAIDLGQATEVEAVVPKFIDYLAQYIWMKQQSDQSPDDPKEAPAWYRYAKGEIKNGLIRDRIITTLMMQNFLRNPSATLLQDALLSVQDPYALKMLGTLQNSVAGTQIYPFSLPDINGKYHQAADYAGKVIFMDFWYASCIPCQNYMVNVVSPVKQLYKDNPEVVFITVSTDNKALFERMLGRADFLPKEGIHLYTDNLGFKHPMLAHYHIRAYPHPLLIDKQGRVFQGEGKMNSIVELRKAIDAVLSQ